MVHLQFLKSEKNCISGEMFHKKKYIENNKNNRKDMTDNDEKLNVLSIVKKNTWPNYTPMIRDPVKNQVRHLRRIQHVAVGTNNLRDMLQNISTEVNQIYTNVCIKANCIPVLDECKY